jgi:hypothetical protein
MTFQIIKIKNNKREYIASYDTLFDAEVDIEIFESEADDDEKYIIETYIIHHFFDQDIRSTIVEYEFIK